jgi:protein TIF31
LQATNENASSLNLLNQAVDLTTAQFGQDHLSTAQTLHQLTQAHFLVNDIPSALSSAEKAHEIFKTRLGEDHAQTKELQRNVELLRVVIENAERQKQASKAQVERIQSAAKLGGLGRYRKVDEKGNVVIAPPAALQAESSATGARSNIGTKGTLDVDELVQFINGGSGGGAGGGSGQASRGKNGLRGKKRTGAKR